MRLPGHRQRATRLHLSKVRRHGPSIEIDRSVRALVENALSVYRVHDEQLKTLRPNVIVTQSQCELCAVSQSDVEASVASVLDGETAIASLEAVDLAGLWRDIEHVGSAIQVDTTDLIQHLQNRIADIRRDGQSAPKPSHRCLEWLDPLMFAGNWVPELVSMAGGEDIFAVPGSHSGVIEWDQIRLEDPDIIVLMPCGYDLPRTQEELPLITKLPGWSELRAVETGSVVATDGNHFFNRPGPRLVESLEILVEIFHPDECGKYGHHGTAWTQADMT
jgi:iron complex transport system substrate-binding protein